LLTEETINMVHGILSGFSGDFWIESERTAKGILCRICVSARKDIDEIQEDRLLKVSSTGVNEDAKGIMGKIRQILRWSVQRTGTPETDEEWENAYSSYVWYSMGSFSNEMNAFDTGMMNYWSLQQYRDAIETKKDDNAEAHDELEKSIIAKIADEVKVGIRSGRAEVIIEKLFAV
ncbi:MAG: hypothetical protein ILP19_03590, partial [Oscillospiraceae bacterium]|nr:hypothetical protein [Oscillospiraceae bacterium]